MISISNREKSRRLAFFRRIVTEDIFFSESGKIIQDKIFELCLRISERENLPQKFIGSCLGYSYPYPSTSVPKLNDAARFNQNRPRAWQPFVMAVLIEQGEVFPSSLFSKPGLITSVIGGNLLCRFFWSIPLISLLLTD